MGHGDEWAARQRLAHACAATAGSRGSRHHAGGVQRAMPAAAVFMAASQPRGRPLRGALVVLPAFDQFSAPGTELDKER
jgi:hypothetical protein